MAASTHTYINSSDTVCISEPTLHCSTYLSCCLHITFSLLLLLRDDRNDTMAEPSQPNPIELIDAQIFFIFLRLAMPIFCREKSASGDHTIPGATTASVSMASKTPPLSRLLRLFSTSYVHIVTIKNG